MEPGADGAEREITVGRRRREDEQRIGGYGGEELVERGGDRQPRQAFTHPRAARVARVRALGVGHAEVGEQRDHADAERADPDLVRDLGESGDQGVVRVDLEVVRLIDAQAARDAHCPDAFVERGVVWIRDLRVIRGLLIVCCARHGWT